jgi:hypothetical protein
LLDLLQGAIRQAREDFGQIVTKRDFQTPAAFYDRENSGAILSIVETCRRLKLSVRDYLAAVLPALFDRTMNEVKKRLLFTLLLFSSSP